MAQRETNRPSVDVVVPFAGSWEALERVAAGLTGLELADGDTVVVADNTIRGAPRARRLGSILVVPADGVPSSYFARNRGAEVGCNAWVLFLDADVDPPARLLDAYFETDPADSCAVLAGAVRDLPAPSAAGRPIAVRYAYARAFIDQEGTMRDARWAYAKTANCAVRRAAFEAVGGFRENIRSGGDADLCFRLKESGWTLEWRRQAEVVHRSRETVRSFLRQTAKHGSGSEWLERRYPGFSPRGRTTRLAYRVLGSVAHGTLAALRGDREEMLFGYLDAARGCSFHLGRMRPNVVHPAVRGGR